jgi:hypothetical protein
MLTNEDCKLSNNHFRVLQKVHYSCEVGRLYYKYKCLAVDVISIESGFGSRFKIPDPYLYRFLTNFFSKKSNFTDQKNFNTHCLFILRPPWRTSKMQKNRISSTYKTLNFFDLYLFVGRFCLRTKIRTQSRSGPKTLILTWAGCKKEWGRELVSTSQTNR